MSMNKKILRQSRHRRIRARVRGTSDRPRLSVFRSNNHIWAQLIDDRAAKTMVAASDLELGSSKKKSSDKGVLRGTNVGALLAKKAKENKITKAVFDRSGYRYHGTVKALAEGARKGGLQF